MIDLLQGDCRAVLASLPAGSVHCCVSSPPYYGLRSYLPEGHPDKAKEAGLEPTLAEYIAGMVAVFRDVRRVLRDDATCWVNLGDSYAGSWGAQGRRVTESDDPSWHSSQIKNHPKRASNTGSIRDAGLKPKDLMMVPARLAIALQDDGWWVRSDIIWAKPNPMPESVSGSQFIRHQVTLAEYERLSRLRRSRVRSVNQGTSNLPGLQTREIPAGQTPVSAEREGKGEREVARGARGRAGKKASGGTVCAGSSEPEEVCGDGQGQSDRYQAREQIPLHRGGQAEGCGEPYRDQGHARADPAAGAGEREVCQDGEDEGEEAPRLRKAEIGAGDGETVHGGNVAGDAESPQAPLLLLQEAPDVDARPHNGGEQGRPARRGEHRSGVPVLQCTEERQDDPDLLIDCPGCEKCERHGGYILRMSAGRPTSGHEHVFLLTKSATYFFDAEAVREAETMNPQRRLTPREANPDAKVHGQPLHRRPEGGVGGGTRNIRNVWTIATESFSGAHFATYPTELVSRCVKAGTSERGCCPACGAPWVRIVEKGAPDIEHQRACGGDATGGYSGKVVKDYGPSGAQDASATKARILAGMTARETTGWKPTCTCPPADPVPCTVLDPFMGSGTTALVAQRLGRSAIGVELNPDYVSMAWRRLQAASPFERINPEPDAPEHAGPLFGGGA